MDKSYADTSKETTEKPGAADLVDAPFRPIHPLIKQLIGAHASGVADWSTVETFKRSLRSAIDRLGIADATEFDRALKIFLDRVGL